MPPEEEEEEEEEKEEEERARSNTPASRAAVTFLGEREDYYKKCSSILANVMKSAIDRSLFSMRLSRLLQDTRAHGIIERVGTLYLSVEILPFVSPVPGSSLQQMLHPESTMVSNSIILSHINDVDDDDDNNNDDDDEEEEEEEEEEEDNDEDDDIDDGDCWGQTQPVNGYTQLNNNHSK
ncbi:hypothetical protein PoB_003525100 [Plakobranchus ocellatus]|uniref:Uncharacterized protein n=1 Tax=Plakobranchus ocellatus TaxID=259542 RepID=A0AAV4AQ82_9GAST|nr:hypothetical protein PoB_003525100 [Plakobranchus ocellatus]